MKSLQTPMKEQLAEGGVAIPGGRDPHIELIETVTGRVWMSVEPVSERMIGGRRFIHVAGPVQQTACNGFIEEVGESAAHYSQ